MRLVPRYLGLLYSRLKENRPMIVIAVLAAILNMELLLKMFESGRITSLALFAAPVIAGLTGCVALEAHSGWGNKWGLTLAFFAATLGMWFINSRTHFWFEPLNPDLWFPAILFSVIATASLGFSYQLFKVIRWLIETLLEKLDNDYEGYPILVYRSAFVAVIVYTVAGLYPLLLDSREWYGWVQFGLTIGVLPLTVGLIAQQSDKAAGWALGGFIGSFASHAVVVALATDGSAIGTMLLALKDLFLHSQVMLAFALLGTNLGKVGRQVFCGSENEEDEQVAELGE
jgi:hypothetical protein